MPIAHNLGFPPLGPNRELKRATEGYWSSKVSRTDLLRTGAALRAAHWGLQRDAGLDLIPSNDFSYYDRVLDTSSMVAAVPARYGWSGGPVDLDTYFAMARGVQAGGRDVTAMEMTKWFDTNYHYLVPEFDRGQAFRLASTKPVDEFQEAKALGFHTKPVLIGPVTFLLLGKTRAAAFDRLELLDALLPVYGEVLARLAAAGATWVQLDEPSIAVDRTPQELAAYGRAYRFLTERAPQLKLLVATYFAGLEDSLATARELPVAGLHVDVVRAPRQLDPLLKAWPKGRVLSLGVVDGRNVWRADLAAALGLLERARERIGADELWVAPSCSLLHVPVDLDLERRLDPDLKGWLAFAKQKLAEVATLTRAVRDGRQAVAAELEANARAIAGRRSSRRIHDPAVKQRAGAVGDRDLRRASPHAARRKQQLRLPLFPTTTIGSCPQTMTVRWSTYAQSRTAKPVKGMLTGPVTILQWSFVRDDQPRAETAKQLALAIRDEVKDLEAAGIRVIQIDEPALREGLPLRRAEWPGYLEWAVNAFRLATAGASDATQIHTHMCYSEFSDVIRVIEKMDADVISIENARSVSELLEGFKEYRYPNEIGPGVYDIHSPRVPTTAEIVQALKRMQEVLDDRQIWVNPDCGLKTRGWQETLAALRNLVHAARQMRPVPSPTGAPS